jgi:hypothetical protein
MIVAFVPVRGAPAARIGPLSADHATLPRTGQRLVRVTPPTPARQDARHGIRVTRRDACGRRGKANNNRSPK